jgi:hypothetical protein
MVINCVFFLKIATSLHRVASKRRGNANHGLKPQSHRREMRAIISVFFLMGLGWTFAAFLNVTDADTSLAFQYLFTICVTLQGFLIFLLQCAFNESVREALRPAACTSILPSSTTSPLKGTVPGLPAAKGSFKYSRQTECTSPLSTQDGFTSTPLASVCVEESESKDQPASKRLSRQDSRPLVIRGSQSANMRPPTRGSQVSNAQQPTSSQGGSCDPLDESQARRGTKWSQALATYEEPVPTASQDARARAKMHLYAEPAPVAAEYASIYYAPEAPPRAPAPPGATTVTLPSPYCEPLSVRASAAQPTNEYAEVPPAGLPATTVPPVIAPDCEHARSEQPSIVIAQQGPNDVYIDPSALRPELEADQQSAYITVVRK